MHQEEERKNSPMKIKIVFYRKGMTSWKVLSDPLLKLVYPKNYSMNSYFISHPME